MPKLTDDNWLNQFQRTIINNLDEADVPTVCKAMHVDYESLPGRRAFSKVPSLLLQINDRDQIEQLISTLKKIKPGVAWDNLLKQPQPKEQGTTTAKQKNKLLGCTSSFAPYAVVIAAIITGLCALIGNSLTGFTNILIADKPIVATQTAEAKLTSAAFLWTATPLHLVSFETPNAVSPTPNVVMKTPTNPPTTQPQQVEVTVIGTTDTPVPTSPPVPPNETISIYQQNTGIFFNQELILTVYAASYTKGTTTFGISAPGFPEIVISDAQIGSRYRYDKNGIYEISVTGFSSFSDVADFTVTRLQKPSQPVPQGQSIDICVNHSATIFDGSLTLAVFKASGETNQVSMNVFDPVNATLRVENQAIGSKFHYEGLAKFEIQVMDISNFSNCATILVWKLN